MTGVRVGWGGAGAGWGWGHRGRKGAMSQDAWSSRWRAELVHEGSSSISPRPLPSLFSWNGELRAFLFIFYRRGQTHLWLQSSPEWPFIILRMSQAFKKNLLLIHNSLICNFRDSTVSASLFSSIKRKRRRYEHQNLSRLKHSC